MGRVKLAVACVLLLISYLPASGSAAATRPAPSAVAAVASPDRPVPTATPAGPAPTPAARSDAAVAYDGAHDVVLLFGGTGAGGANLADTWSWDGQRWTRRPSPDAPPAGRAGSMAFDGASGKVVLFAGAGTWTWDGDRWTREQPAHQPPRAGQLAYDPSLGVVVLYLAGAGTSTWGWNGADWYPINDAGASGPVAVEGLAYDVRGARLLSCGDATWAFIGLHWTRLGDLPDGLPATGAAVASSLTLNEPVAFGGGGLWAWDGKAWQRHDADQRPPERSGAALADDEKRQRLVLFGGTGPGGAPLGDTWTWKPDGGWERAA